MTTYLEDLKGQELFVGGTQVLPTKKQWELIGASADYNATTGRVELTVGAGVGYRPVLVATAAALPAHSSTATVLTADAVGALTIDGVAMGHDERVLVKDEASTAKNGLYVVTEPGEAGAQWVLTRSTYGDQDGELYCQASVRVASGTANANTEWVLTTADPIVVGTTGLTFTLATASATNNGTYNGEPIGWHAIHGHYDPISTVGYMALGEATWPVAGTAGASSLLRVAPDYSIGFLDDGTGKLVRGMDCDGGTGELRIGYSTGADAAFQSPTLFGIYQLAGSSITIGSTGTITTTAAGTSGAGGKVTLDPNSGTSGGGATLQAGNSQNATQGGYVRCYGATNAAAGTVSIMGATDVTGAFSCTGAATLTGGGTVAGDFYPTTTNTRKCGKAGNVWLEVRATNFYGILNTADINFYDEKCPFCQTSFDELDCLGLFVFHDDKLEKLRRTVPAHMGCMMSADTGAKLDARAWVLAHRCGVPA